MTHDSISLGAGSPSPAPGRRAVPASPLATHPMNPSPPSRFNPWPYGIIAAFVVFVGGIVTLVVAATRGSNELVTRDYYEQELRYQSRVDQLARTRFWSNRITAAFDSAGRRVKVTVPREHAAAGAKGQVQLYRPSAENADHTLALTPDAEGSQTIDAATLTAGLWKVRLEWKVGADEFYADRSVVIAAP